MIVFRNTSMQVAQVIFISLEIKKKLFKYEN